MSDKIFAKYKGNGAYFADVPSKDLTKEEFDELPALARRDVLAETLYDIVKSDKKSEKSDSGDKS